MGNTQKPIQKKEIRPSTSVQQRKDIVPVPVEKKESLKITASVKPPALLQQLHIRQHDNPSLDEAIYMAEDLFCINDGEKLKEPLHRSVGALTFLNSYNHRGFGSGILISQDTVLTAAHNIYQRLRKQKNKQFRFYLGAKGVTQDFYEIQTWKYPDEYQTCHQNVSRQYDYAIMKLKKPVDHFKEFLLIKIPCSTCLLKDNSKILKVYGFPAIHESRPNEKPIIYKDNFKVLSEDGKKLNLFQYGLARSDRIRFFDITGKKIGYEMSTLPGQSGAPVIIDDCIIAIHSGNGDRKQFNQGRIIDQDLLENLQRWGDLLGTQSFCIRYKKQCGHRPYIMGTFTMTDKSKIQRIGFGIIISKNLVLTAAHNLFDRDKKANYQNLRFYLGSTIKTGERFISIASFNYPNQYKTCKSSLEMMYDYALVKLVEEVPFNQFMDISLPCHQCFLSNKQRCVDLFGFPKYFCDKGKNGQNPGSLNNIVQQIRLFQYGIFHVDDIYDIDLPNCQMKGVIKTYQGGSVGAPLIEDNLIIAISNICNETNKSNIARWIDKQFVYNIEIWSKQMNGKKLYCIKKSCSHTIIPRLYEIDSQSFEQIGVQNIIEKKLPSKTMKNVIDRSTCAIHAFNKYNEQSPVIVTGVLLSKNIVLISGKKFDQPMLENSYTNFSVMFEESDGISKKSYQIQAFRFKEQFLTTYNQKMKERQCYALLKLKKPVNYDKFPKISLLPCHECVLTQNYNQLYKIFGNSYKGQFVGQFLTGKTYSQLLHYGSEGKGTITKIPCQYRIQYNLQSNSKGGSPVIIKGRLGYFFHCGHWLFKLFHGAGGILITPKFVATIKKWCVELQGEIFQVINEDHVCA